MSVKGVSHQVVLCGLGWAGGILDSIPCTSPGTVKGDVEVEARLGGGTGGS